MHSGVGSRGPGKRGDPPGARHRSSVRLLALRQLWWHRSGSAEVLAEGEPRRVVLKRDALYRRLIASGDVLSALISLVVAVVLVGGDQLRLLAIGIVPLLMVIVKIVGLYDRDNHLLHKSTLDEAPKLFQVATVLALLFWLGARLFVVGPLDRPEVATLWVLLFALLVLLRATMRRLASAIAQPERCLVIGSTAVAVRLAAKAASTTMVQVEICGRMALSANEEPDETDTASVGSLLAVRQFGAAPELPDVVKEHSIDRVIIAPSEQESDELLDLIRTAKALGVKVSIVPRLFEVVGSSVAFDDVEGLTLLGIRPFGLSRSSALLKQAFDLSVAAALLVVAAPCLVVAALAVKLTSPGPVFFRQRRIGQDDREFSMLKFRTMVDGAEAMKAALRSRNECQGLFKIADDPRITPVGRLLRRTSLDELPQLLNVLRGEMSLVGPRPLVPEEDAMIGGLNRRRLLVPPGMTGQWQILGSGRIPMHEMVKIDYLYGANWSLWGDLKILLRTGLVVAGRRGL